MKLIKTERHTVIVKKFIEIPEEDLIEEFGSVENAQTAFDDFSEEWTDFMFELEGEYVADTEEDWISDRKGYTEVDWEKNE